MYYVKKTMEISAAHRLTLDYESKCTQLHGHNWMVTVFCKAEELDKEPSDPTPPPKTGENTTLWILWAVAGSALLLIFILSIRIGKERTKK